MIGVSLIAVIIEFAIFDDNSLGFDERSVFRIIRKIDLKSLFSTIECFSSELSLDFLSSLLSPLEYLQWECEKTNKIKIIFLLLYKLYLIIRIDSATKEYANSVPKFIKIRV